MDRSSRRGVQRQPTSSLLKYANNKDLKGIVTLAAQQTLDIELKGHQGEIAAESFDRVAGQMLLGMQHMVRMALQSGGFDLEIDQAKEIVRNTVGDFIDEYRPLKLDMMRAVAESITGTLAEIDDGTFPSTTDACEPTTSRWPRTRCLSVAAACS